MMRQTGMGQSTPNLATKASPGPPVTAPRKAQGQGAKGSTWSPVPKAPPRQCSRHLAADIMEPGQSVVGWNPTGVAGCLSYQGSSFLSWDQQEHMDQGPGGTKGHPNKEKVWVRGV